jgi:predicted ATPase
LIFLKKIRCEAPLQREAFPFSLSFIPSLTDRSINQNILFFVGENGSGKSTLLEAIAMASRRINIGATDLDKDGTLVSVKPLADSIRLGWNRQSRKGFFLRAEDFFGFVHRNQNLVKEFDEHIDRFRDDDRVRGYMEANQRAINAKYGQDLNDYSHGEGFLEFFKSRIVPGGLYLIDEPEAAFSPQRQLAFILLIVEMAKQDCQFIIASHSPIILRAPDAQIWAFSEDGIEETNYNELDHVTFTKNFLESPERFWKQLLEE